MAPGADVVEDWARSLPEPATWELVRPGFYYVRVPGERRRWIPIEIVVGPRSMKLTSHVIPEPEEDRERVYELLLRHNHAASGVAFSYDGREGVLCLVGRIPRDQLTSERLDEFAGLIVQATETAFPSILRIGFATRMRRAAERRG